MDVGQLMLAFRKRREDRPSYVPAIQLVRWIPNALTATSACLGLYAIRFALDGRFEESVAFIFMAAVCDGLDGLAARSFNAASQIGAELDSLADFLSFGVAPAFIVYLWSLEKIQGVGWALALLFVICSGYRLARFNASLHSVIRPSWAKEFFTGIPAPAAAGCAMLLPVLSFASSASWARHWSLNAAMLVAVALMMISRVPTFSTKAAVIRIKKERYPLAVFGLLFLSVALVYRPWWTLAGGILAYALSIPISTAYARRLRRAHEAEQSARPRMGPGL